MKRLPIHLLRFLVLAMFLTSILPARAQQSVVQLPDIYVTSDNYSIHVRHKVGAQTSKVPVLLVHGSWGNSQTWDFPGRSVMDYLAVRGYDVYALDLRGMGTSVPAPMTPTDYFPIDILGRVRDAAAVAGYIRDHTGRVPVVFGWSQGGLITGLLVASDPQHQLAAGVGLLSVPPAALSYHLIYSGTCREYYFLISQRLWRPRNPKLMKSFSGPIPSPANRRFRRMHWPYSLRRRFCSRIVRSQSWRK